MAMEMEFAPSSIGKDRVYERFFHLPPRHGEVCLEYIWASAAAVSGDPVQMLSKTKVVDKEPKSMSELTNWIFDGVATRQAPGMDSECTLVPVLMCEDPFRLSPHKLVLCEVRKHDGTPVASNTRDEFCRLLRAKPSSEPWWGIEQEVTLLDPSKSRVLGWPKYGKPMRGSVYCRSGTDVVGRKIMEAHLRACMYAGLRVTGINLECLPGMIEFQVGPLEGVLTADHTWMARYILIRMCEEFGVAVTFSPKPAGPEHAGAGFHTNFSTKAMREDGGFEEILRAVDRLAQKHFEHIALYGVGNEDRLTGKDDAPSIETFTFGVATRAAAVRVPRECERRKKGFLEDRRPAANCDPYQACAKMFKTCVIEDDSVPFAPRHPNSTRAQARTKEEMLRRGLSTGSSVSAASSSSANPNYSERGLGLAGLGSVSAESGTPAAGAGSAGVTPAASVVIAASPNPASTMTPLNSALNAEGTLAQPDRKPTAALGSGLAAEKVAAASAPPGGPGTDQASRPVGLEAKL